MKKVSLKDIAKEVGVSTTLVSYVLNGKEKEARVGREIATVIRDTAAKLNYQPNQIAKSLKSGKSYTLGLILADISNPFFANLARIIEDEAKKSNYTVIFASSDENSEKSSDLINLLTNRQVDGFIIAPAEGSQKQVENLIDRHIPFVLIDRHFPSVESSYVITDNYQASYDAVSHLAETGHKKIALIIYKSSLVHMQERKRGYLDALKDRKLISGPSLIKEIDYYDIQKESDKVFKELLSKEKTIDAIFFATNTLSMFGLKALNKYNRSVPTDVAVVSFDESDAFDFFYSPITFIHQPIAEVGVEAVRILLDQINQENTIQKGLTIKSKLVIRESSGK